MGRCMLNRAQIFALAAIFAIPFFFSIPYGTNLNSPGALVRLISPAVTAVSVALWVFNFGLWRFLPRSLAPKPDLNGTWKVEIKPFSSNPGPPRPPIVGFMFVTQTYANLSMRLETEDTWSELEAEQITISKAGHYQLWAVYHCRGHIPGRTPDHYGAMILNYRKTGDGVRLGGHFWIDGDLKDSAGLHLDDGLIELYAKKRKRYATFSDASKHFT